MCAFIRIYWVRFSKLDHKLSRPVGTALPLMPCYVQCPAHSGAVHLDSLWTACLCRVKLTITSFVVASGLVTLMKLRVPLNCLPWYHNDPGVICASSILGKMSTVLSSQCEHKEFTEGKMIPMRRREKYEVLFSLHPHISHVSIEGCGGDIHWGGVASYKKWVNICSDSGYFFHGAFRMWKQETWNLLGSI